MNKIFAFILLFSFSIFGSENYNLSPLQSSAKLEKDISNGKLAERTELALDTAINVTANELIKAGYVLEGKSFQGEWYSTYKSEFHDFAFGIDSHDIGDHKPLNQWLADEYDKIEVILGVSFCKSTHISDLKTFNFTIPIVFKPCTFPMDAITIGRIDEYRNHFSEGKIYFGLVPVVSYWITYAAVTGATMGTGYFFVAGLVGDAAEHLITYITPKLSDSIFTKSCGGF